MSAVRLRASSGVLLAACTLSLATGCRGPAKAKAEAGAAGAGSAAAPVTVSMSADAVRAAGVSTVRAAQANLVIRDEVPGTVEAPRDGLAIVNTTVAGVVDSLEFDVGDRVRAGQKIATIRSVQLAEAEAAYQRAVAAGQYAATALERSESLRRDGVLSERRLEEERLAANEKKLALQEATDRVRILGGSPGSSGGTVAVLAPVGGVIAARSASRGQAVEANSPLYTVVDASRVVVHLRALAGTPVVPGARLPFTVEDLPGRTFTAVVNAASDLLDPQTRRFVVRCSVDNGAGVLKPGMFVTGRLPRQSVRALVVPETAVQLMPDGPVVFVVNAPGRFERRSVVTGARADGQVAIEKGLGEGETVVAEGAFWVRTQMQKSEIEE